MKKIIEFLLDIFFTPVVLSLLATIFAMGVIILTTSCSKQQTVVVESTPLKVREALLYAKNNDMDTTVCILVDFTKPSSEKRMALVDLQTEKVISRGLVCHGMGRTYSSTPQFSNDVNSHLSSLGRYRIGSRAWSQWGIHIKYVLHGLDSTNSNAEQRYVVLHSWSAIPDSVEGKIVSIAEGYGCPAVSNNYMLSLDTVLRGRKDVLLWIYV